MRLFNDSRGDAWPWLVILVGLLFVVVLFSIMLPATLLVGESLNETMNDTLGPGNVRYESAMTVYNNALLIVEMAIMFLLVGLIIWGFARVIYREGGEWPKQ